MVTRTPYRDSDCVRIPSVLPPGMKVKSMLKDLQTLQREVADWSRENFGDNVSKWTGQKLFSQNALTGLVEEVGDLNGITIQYHQGRRGYDPTTEEGQKKYVSNRNDAIADIMIFLMDYCDREGVDLLTVVNDTWTNIVSKRNAKTRASWEKHSHDPAEAAAGAALEQPSTELPNGSGKLSSDGMSHVEVQKWWALIKQALDRGWTISKSTPTYAAGFLTLRGDASEHWAAEWLLFEFQDINDGQRFYVPNWVGTRIMQLDVVANAPSPPESLKEVLGGANSVTSPIMVTAEQIKNSLVEIRQPIGKASGGPALSQDPGWVRQPGTQMLVPGPNVETRNDVPTDYAAINPEMNRHAAHHGLQHWVCIDPSGNSQWRRVDGTSYTCFRSGGDDYRAELKKFDQDYPMRAVVVPHSQTGQGWAEPPEDAHAVVEGNRVCNLCGQPVKFVEDGQRSYWTHVGEPKPRHPATPKVVEGGKGCLADALVQEKAASSENYTGVCPGCRTKVHKSNKSGYCTSCIMAMSPDRRKELTGQA